MHFLQKRLPEKTLEERKKFVDMLEAEIRDLEVLHERRRDARGGRRSLARSLQEARRKEREGRALSISTPSSSPS